MEGENGGSEVRRQSQDTTTTAETRLAAFCLPAPPPSALGVRVYEREESRKADRCREVRNTEVATFAKDDDVL